MSKDQHKNSSEYSEHSSAGQLLSKSYVELQKALGRADAGVSSRIHELDNTVTFMLDNQKEVVLRVRKIDIEHIDGDVQAMHIYCRTDFENVLILAKKLNMKISAFSAHFTVVLKANEAFLETWSEAIMNMRHPSKFFETLDELKRPIFLNINHYIVARISD